MRDLTPILIHALKAILAIFLYVKGYHLLVLSLCIAQVISGLIASIVMRWAADKLDEFSRSIK